MTVTVYVQERQGYGAVEVIPGETMMQTAEIGAELIMSSFNLALNEDAAIQWIKEAGVEGTDYRLLDITVTVTVKATEA